MRVFVSGATGYIGIQLVKRLAGSGAQVHALYTRDDNFEAVSVLATNIPYNYLNTYQLIVLNGVITSYSIHYTKLYDCIC